MVVTRQAATLLFLALASGLAWTPTGARGQERDVRIVGRLVAGADSIPAAGAHVVAGEGTPVRTDRSGRFVLRAVPGERRLTAVVIDGSTERIYTALFRVPDRDVIRFSWWVGPEVESGPRTPDPEPIPIEGLVVTVERRILERDHAAERGDYLDRAAIEALGPGIRGVGDLVRRLAGVRVVPAEGSTVCVVPSRGRMQLRAIAPGLSRDPALSGPRDRGCPEMVTVVLDGLVLREGAHAVASIPASDVESVRFVGGITATQRYGRHGRWGALVIRTRRP